MCEAEKIAQKYTKDQLWDKFDKLPERVRDVILAPKTTEILDNIIKKNGVSEERGLKLVRYIDFIRAGIVPITLLRETMQEEFQIDEGHARKIAEEVRDKIFMQVKKELHEIHKL